jgi:hypothetical protein
MIDHKISGFYIPRDKIHKAYLINKGAKEKDLYEVSIDLKTIREVIKNPPL